MFFDEEGDLAHEFYEEIQEDASSKSKMCRKYNVLPQVGSQINFFTNPLFVKCKKRHECCAVMTSMWYSYSFKCVTILLVEIQL